MDKKQVLDFNGPGGYIRQKKLEEFLAKKFGRQIRVEVRLSGGERISGPSLHRGLRKVLCR